MALPSPPIAYYPLGTSAYNGEYLAENNAIGDYVFDFDGNDKVNCGTATSYDNFTLSAWVNKDSLAPDYASIFGTRNTPTSPAIFPHQISLDTGGYVRLIADGTIKVLSNNPISNGHLVPHCRCRRWN